MLAGLAVALSLTSCSTGQNAEAVEPKRPSALADGAVCADWLRARSDVREQYASWRLTENPDHADSRLDNVARQSYDSDLNRWHA